MQGKQSQAEDRSDWLLTKVLPIGSFYPGHSFSVGQVEINYRPVEPPEAQRALEGSKKSFRYEADISSLPRIKVIVHDTSQIEALNHGSQLIEEALDVINFCALDFGDVRSLGIGYMQDLRTKRYYPIKPEDDIALTPMFVRDTELDNPYPWNLFRMILEKPKQSRSELEQRVLNAVSWLRQAKFQRNTIRELLFRWIALEILLKEQEKEVVSSKALVTIGFPEGEIFNHRLSSDDQQALKKQPKFKTWKREIKKRFKEIQDLRNEIVHQGFKDVELSAVGCRHSLETYLHLMHMAAGRAIGFACMGIALGCSTVEELWSRKDEVFAIQYPDCSHEVLKNVIPILESPVNL